MYVCNVISSYVHHCVQMFITVRVGMVYWMNIWGAHPSYQVLWVLF